MPTPYGFEVNNPYSQIAGSIMNQNTTGAPPPRPEQTPTIPNSVGKVIAKGVVNSVSNTPNLSLGSSLNWVSGGSQPWLLSGTSDLVATPSMSLGTLPNPANNLMSGSADLSLGGGSYLSGEAGLANVEAAGGFSSSSSTSSAAGQAGSFANAAAGVVGGLAGNYLASISGLGGGREGSSIGGAAGAVIGQVAIPIPGVGAGIGAFLGNIAGSFFGDDGDWPYARYAVKAGEVTINDQLDGGPIDNVTKMGEATNNNLVAIASHYGIPKESLPDAAIGVASGRKGSNLGSGIWTTINSNGGFQSDPKKVRNFDDPQAASADMILRSLQFSNLSGTPKDLQQKILSYDGSNGVETLASIMAPVAGNQSVDYTKTMLAAGRTPSGIPLVNQRRETDESTFLDSLRRYKENVQKQGVVA